MQRYKENINLQHRCINSPVVKVAANLLQHSKLLGITFGHHKVLPCLYKLTIPIIII